MRWLLLALIPLPLLAHEVYVLDPATVAAAMATPAPNPFLAYFGNEFRFYFWGFISAIVFLTMIAASLFHVFEQRFDPFLFRLKKFALPVARISVGLCFIAFAYSGNVYGSELFLSDAFGPYAGGLAITLALLGVMATFGIATRLTGLLMTILYVVALSAFGPYLLTYTDFLGVAVLLMVLGGGLFSFDSIRGEPFVGISRVTRRLRPYAFAVLRVCFGWGVMYASVYAKFIHSPLALAVVTEHDLTRFFPFDPLFIVLGALIIEFIAGAMVLFGVALRWTLLFLAFWLTLSLLYFQELIWPHGILFGLAVALFLHGYDRYSLEGYLLKKRGREPVM